MIDVVTVGRRRRLDRLGLPRGHAQGRARSRPAPTPGPLCYAKGGTEPTITDAHVSLGRIPPHLLGGEIPLDVDAARAGIDRARRPARARPRALRDRHPRDLRVEPGQRPAPGLGQARPRRARLHARRPSAARARCSPAGSSTSSASPASSCRRTPATSRPSACSPSTSRTTTCRPHVARHDALDHAAVQKTFDDLTAKAASALDAEGFPRDSHRYARTVDLRYFGQAYEVRVAAPEGDVDEAYAAGVADALPRRAPRALRLRLPRTTRRQQVEWVNLRVTGVGPITRPELREPRRAPTGAADVRERAHRAVAAGLLRRRRRLRRHRRLLAPRPARRRHLRRARRSSRSSARPSRSTPASPSASTRSATSSSPRSARRAASARPPTDSPATPHRAERR